MKTKTMKIQSGITLIALVITIIVLLILAGVAISMLSGENGILKQAAEAKTETDEKSIVEKLQLAVLSARTKGLGKIDYDKLNEEFSEVGFNRGAQEDGKYENDVQKLPEIIEVNKAHYAVSEDGKVVPTNWYYKKDAKKRKTIVTNGTIELPIGTYINYNAAATDADETTIEEKTVISEAGTLIATDYYKASEQTVTEGNGYGVQTFKNTAATNGWRVLGIDESTGEILIISADSVQTSAASNFYLRGIAGYTYGEAQLDKVCGVFGSGYGATGARSIDVDDINRVTGYNPENTGKYDPEQTGTGIKYGKNSVDEYGNKLKYTWNPVRSGIDYIGGNNVKGRLTNSHSSYGFNWYNATKNKWENNSKYTGEITTLTSNYYYYYPNSLGTSNAAGEGFDTGSDEYKTLFCDSTGKGKAYWLASSYVSAQTGYVCFCIRMVRNDGFVRGEAVYYSYGYAYSKGCPVRPVVSLKSDIKLQYDGTNLYYDIVK